MCESDSRRPDEAFLEIADEALDLALGRRPYVHIRAEAVGWRTRASLRGPVLPGRRHSSIRRSSLLS